MSELQKCSRCGAQLPLESLSGHCISCLLQLGLESDDSVTKPLESPAATFFTGKPGDRIGRYKLLQQIGEGGCGVVYMAEQEAPVRRCVALKVIKLGMDTKQVIARFEAERQALALMDHPNIAKVLDAGATDTGRPYFVMELVRGVKITTYCDQQNLSTRHRLDLFVQVCQAVQHAHQKGIIHRDLKPSNILVTEQDGKAVPKIIDFGIAKATTGAPLTDKTLFTAFEQFIGTPAYMSPEQAGLGGLDIDTRSDIYSLGVLLYELLTGKQPFDSAELRRSAIDEILRTICEKEPARPSAKLTTLSEQELTQAAERRQIEPAKFVHQLRGDLDWIVMKALEKDRARRYETANGLAKDIQRHLNMEPVIARPPSAAYRFQKTFRRNRFAFTAVGAVAFALLLGTVGSTWQAIRASQLRVKAEIAEQAAKVEAAKSRQVAQFLQNMLNGAWPSVAQGRDTTLLREILERTSVRIGTDLKDQPDVEEELRCTIGKVYYFCLLDYSKAEAMFKPALILREKRLGNDSLSVAELADVLGLVLLNTHHLTEAEEMSRKALAITRRALGTENEKTAQILSNLGLILRDEGKFSEAAKVECESLEIYRKLFGAKDKRVTRPLSNLASVLLREGKADEAFAKFREAAEMGDSGAQANLAYIYEAGERTDYNEAVKWARKSAEQFNATGEDHLGYLYENGLGVEVNPAEAAKWYLKSADRGIGPAQIHLGQMYESGRGVEKSYNEAAKWYRKAADRNLADGLYHLGKLYEQGTGLPKDFNVAVKLYQKAAEKDHLYAQLDLAGMYERGEGVPKNMPAAVKWRRRAAEKDDPNILNAVAWSLATSTDPELRDGASAVSYAQKAVALAGRTNEVFLETLAAAYAETGNFSNAVTVQLEAIALHKDTTAKADYAIRLKLYESSTAYRAAER